MVVGVGDSKTLKVKEKANWDGLGTSLCKYSIHSHMSVFPLGQCYTYFNFRHLHNTLWYLYALMIRHVKQGLAGAPVPRYIAYGRPTPLNFDGTYYTIQSYGQPSCLTQSVSYT